MEEISCWAVFDSIVGAIGALATAAAVIVALWQTTYATSEKIETVIF